MIKNNEKSAEILRAEEQLAQAKARLAEAKRKEGARKRKEENQHKYMMGGIVAKYFPKCYAFDEQELNRILSAALAARECRQMIESIEKESTRNAEASREKAEETGAENEDGE